ncbi:alpha/beta hydrolase fold domain-containing protein [Nocardia sp. CA-119907]|uniref:alpha/beta hydrolase fold domain-containing protein n=1 Tax=Nocardia sp. CA-119907 TaxID=3239973 RepID=UPI003D978F1F
MVCSIVRLRRSRRCEAPGAGWCGSTNSGPNGLWHEDRDPRRRDSALLYFHGGGFVGGGLNTHRRMVAKIAQASAMPALSVDYRQLPQAHLTDTVEDAVESYRYLLEQDFPADRMVVSGDSAGGALAFRLALAVRERGLPMPGGISALAHGPIWARQHVTLTRTGSRFLHSGPRFGGHRPLRLCR